MANSRALPVAEPDLVSYPHIAYPLAVMQTDPGCLDWVYSNYIQLSLRDWTDRIMLDFYSPNAYDHPIPALYGSPRLTRSMILRNYPRFSDFVRDCIDDGRYVSTYADDYYIPGSVAYQNRSHPHAIMIHGYNDVDRQFLATGFLANQTFGQTLVDYDDLEAAFGDFEIPDDMHYTNFTLLFKLNRKYRYAFNVSWVMEQLEDYWHASASDQRWKSLGWQEAEPWVWGVEAYDSLIRKIQEQADRTFILDHRPFHVLWEHKRMMNRRIDYMARQGHHVCSPEVTEGYVRLERSAAACRHSVLKFWMTMDNRRLEDSIGLLSRMKTEESLVIERMLHDYRLSAHSEDAKRRNS